MLELLTNLPLADASTASLQPTELFSIASLIALITLASLEIVLGIDNIIFIAIVTQKLPEDQQPKARRVGILVAAGMRIGLLFAISFVLSLKQDWFTVFNQGVSGKDLVLLLGGLFLIAKSTWEIKHQLILHSAAPDLATGSVNTAVAAASFTRVIVQILLIDLVFSLDSVITAAGMTSHLPIMIAAVLISVVVMLVFAGPVARFVEKHPELKILALAFLILIGVLLLAEAFDQHIERGYVYFAMAFAFTIDMLQLRQNKAHQAPSAKQ